MIDYRIIQFSHSLKDLESGEAANRFYRTLSSHHRDIKLDVPSKVSSLDLENQWSKVKDEEDGTVWLFKDKVEVKIDTPPVARGYHRFARIRTIWIDKEKRGFSLAPIRRCIASIQETLEDMRLPLFLVVKPFEMDGWKEVFHHSRRRQQALVNLMLDLGFQYMDRNSWNIASEGSTIYFEERNKDYPLEIPFMIWIPETCAESDYDYFYSFLR
jgi:hypothetical protein